MKSKLLLLVLLSCQIHAFAQFEEIVLRHTPTQPRWVVTCPDDGVEDCTLTVYFRDGRQKAQAKIYYFDKRNKFRPNGNALVYYDNGKVHQEYNHEAGILLTFYRSGELKERFVSPVNGDMEYKFRFYKTGQLWEEEVSKREVGKQNLQFSYSRQMDYFYDNTGYSYNFYKTYHSNGNLMSHVYIGQTEPYTKYQYDFYDIDGVLDTNAVYGKVSGRMMKQGRRYTYYPNGQLQLITPYENDKVSGERLQWAKNGTLIERGNYKSGSRSGKFESWWEDGSLKEISYHRGYYKHGPVLRWHRDGRILEQGTYYDGKAIGIGTVWDTLGNLYGENGGSIEVQQHNWYYRASNIREHTLWYRGEGRFKNGMRDGKWKFYYKEKGKNREPISGLCAVLNYKNGVVHGKITVYHQNGSVLLKTRARDGWLEGDYITYHETGDIVTKGKFKNHKKNGFWTGYHHQSNQIYTIRMYKDDVGEASYKEWDRDGFQVQDRVDNKLKRQVEHYRYYKSGMMTKSVIPYGWKYGHYYQYDDNGKLKRTQIRSKDNPYDYLETAYYPNGQISHTSTLVNSKREGLYKAWFEDGQKQSEIPFVNGKRHGMSYSWNENGVVSATEFKNGIQIISRTIDEAALECACNHPPKEVRSGFMNWFLRYVEYEKVKDRTKYFSISEKHYKKLFSKNIQMYDYRISGAVAALGDVYVEINNGLRLDFTACRRGSNRTFLDLYGDYNQHKDEVIFQVENFDLAVQFPEKLLRLYDVEKKRPLTTKIEKYQRSSVRFSVKKLNYTDKKGSPSVEVKTNGNACFQISEIGTTDILFDASVPILDLSPTDLPNGIEQKFKRGRLSKYQVSYRNAHYFIPSRKHLEEFMGVYFLAGTLTIPYLNEAIKANTHHILIDGKEIHGNLEVSIKDYPNVGNTNDFILFLQSKGFEILKSEIVNNEVLYLFWKFEGR